MKAKFAAVVALLALSGGCPKGGTTAPKDPQPTTDHKPAPQIDAGTPVVKKPPLPAYKPKYKRPPTHLYTGRGVPWFRSRRHMPRLRGLPHKPYDLPPHKLLAKAAIRKALKKAKPNTPERFALESMVAYHAYQRIAAGYARRALLRKRMATTKSWRARYQLRKQLRSLGKRLSTQFGQAKTRYEQLVANKAATAYPELPRAEYQLALLYLLNARHASAQKLWTQVVTQHPGSDAAAAALLALSDRFFELGAYGAARRSYDRAVASGIKLPRDWWRELRHAWTLARTRDGKNAWAALLKLPRGRFIRGMSRAQATLFATTVRRIAPWIYASAGKPSGAVQAMNKIDYRKPWALVRDLAEIYAAQRKRAQAIAVYKLLLARLPHDPDVCLWRFHAVAQQLAGDPTAETIKSLEQVIAMYKKANAARLLPSEGQRNCEREIKLMSANIARRLHRRARKNPTAKAWTAAETLYQLYLDTFSPAPQVHANYAEMVWRRAEMEKDPTRAFALWQAAAKRFVILSHRISWKRLQDRAQKAAAMAWSNAAAIAETGYIEGKTRRDAKALFAESCKVGRTAGFTEGCADEKRLR